MTDNSSLQGPISINDLYKINQQMEKVKPKSNRNNRSMNTMNSDIRNQVGYETAGQG